MLNFRTPLALWWLLPLAGAIIVLYLLKMRRRDMRVPATFLWPATTADVRANAPFQRLRFSWLLVLQLLAVSLFVLGMADPLRQARGLNGKATAIIIDASASMAARDDGRTSRYDDARGKIAAIVGALGTGDRLALIEAGPVTRPVFPLSGDTARMTQALRGLRGPSDAPGDIGEALRLAAAVVGQREGGRIVVFSDGAFAPVTNFSAGKAQVLFEPIGTGGKNVAITAFEAGDTPRGSQVYAGVRNYYTAPVRATLTFTVDGRVVDARNLNIPARQTLGQTLPIPPTAKRAEAKLTVDGGDLLASDNRAALFLQGAGTVRTLLVSPGNLFLERALSLEPTVRLDRAPSVPPYELAGSSGAGRYDLVVFDGVKNPPAVKARSVWAFGAVSPDVAVTDAGLTARPRVTATKREHPVLRSADLSDLLIEKARQVTAKPEGRVIVQGPDGPLIVAGERGDRRSLFVGWSLLDSDFPLQVAFPIFVSNSVRYLTGGGRVGNNEGGGLTVRAGAPFTVAVPAGTTDLTLSGPTGKTEVDGATGLATIRAATQTGDYTLTGKGVKTTITANLLNETESDVTPQASLDVAGGTVKAATKGVASLVLADTWKPIALVLLALLAFEWWYFVKKS